MVRFSIRCSEEAGERKEQGACQYMGDAGEGLVDEESRIQERMEELALARTRILRRDAGDARQAHAVESLRLARIELERQFAATGHERRRVQLAHAIEEIGRRMAEIGARDARASAQG